MVEGNITVSFDEKLAMSYIAGYIAFKHNELAGNPSSNTPDIRIYLEEISRGGLSYPSDKLFTLTSLAYHFMKQSKEPLCRNRLIKVLADFPQMFQLDIAVSQQALQRLVNIFMKRYCTNLMKMRTVLLSVG
ncbi:hypothetical protein ElyMa_003314500 [Elysia marginata]|uniref:SEC7 domain-containing protein n=1 Tax=Elysia marginata TaxID=1093978 RepID=A0AAV4JCV8_9GAST|nr:hypothetical protein ElyMa_003314500 [Elysia marginata]